MIEIGNSPQDGAYGAGVWLQAGAKFGLVALVGVLIFLVYRGGKHVLRMFVQITTTSILDSPRSPPKANTIAFAVVVR